MIWRYKILRKLGFNPIYSIFISAMNLIHRVPTNEIRFKLTTEINNDKTI